MLERQAGGQVQPVHAGARAEPRPAPAGRCRRERASAGKLTSAKTTFSGGPWRRTTTRGSPVDERRPRCRAAAGRRSRARWPGPAGPPAPAAARLGAVARGATAARREREREPACPPPAPPGYSGHRVPDHARSRCATVPRAVRVAMLLALLGLALPAPLVAQAWNAPDALALVRRAAERRARGAGRLDARELSHPGARVRLLPGAGGRGADRAAPAGQGRRAARGSVLAGPGPEQAGHPRLARRRVPPHRHQLPPRSPRHRHQQLRRRHPDRRGRRGARRAPSALAGRARGVRLRAGRLARHPHRRAARPWSARCRCARGRSRRPLVVGTLYLDAATAAAGALPLQLHARRLPRPPARGHQHRARERAASSSATGCPTARRSRSAGAPPGSTSRRGASSGAAGRSRATTSTCRCPPSTVHRGPPSPASRTPSPTDWPVERAARRGGRGRGRAGQPSRTWTRSGWRSSGSPGRGR